MDDSSFLLPAAVAARSQVSELEVHEAIASGELRTVFYRGDVRIPVGAVSEFVRRRRDAGDEERSSQG
ncbi:hypothetical protein ACF1AJ_11235 [Leifsonia sp. NPDC014704]|uniref:hypothetical protein n=1 Tax=Leifsonia sp. NPDC014704 TaxID=3364123 RepID=UPI0036F47FA6